MIIGGERYDVFLESPSVCDYGGDTGPTEAEAHYDLVVIDGRAFCPQCGTMWLVVGDPGWQQFDRINEAFEAGKIAGAAGQRQRDHDERFAASRQERALKERVTEMIREQQRANESAVKEFEEKRG